MQHLSVPFSVNFPFSFGKLNVVVNLLCVSGSHKGHHSRIVPRNLVNQTNFGHPFQSSASSHSNYMLHTALALMLLCTLKRVVLEQWWPMGRQKLKHNSEFQQQNYTSRSAQDGLVGIFVAVCHC